MPLIHHSSVVLSPTLTRSLEELSLDWLCINISAMVCWLVLPFAVRVSLTKCCTLSSSPGTIFLLLDLLPRPKTTKLQLKLYWTPSSLKLRSTGLATPKCSSVLVFWVTWRKSVKTGLDPSCPGCNPRQEARLPGLYSRKCKTKSLPSTASREPSGTGILAKLGCGGSCGLLLSLTSNVQSLLSTKQSMKRRLLLLKLTLTKLLLSMTSLLQKRMSWCLLFKAEDLQYRTSLTR